MDKKLIVSIFFVFIANTVIAQLKNNNTLIARADKFYKEAEYFMAAHEYARAAESDTANNYLTAQLAECYRSLHDYANAELLYKKLLETGQQDYPTARFWYASMLQDNGEFEAAIHHFELFDTETQSSADFELELYRAKSKEEVEECRILLKEAKKQVLRDYGLKCLPAPVNTDVSDFAPVIGEHDSILLVTSERVHAGRKQEGGINSDVHRFAKKGDTLWVAEQMPSGKGSLLNTHFNESSGSFTADMQKYYFTRCDDHVMKDKHREYNCAIYVSNKEGGKWSAPARLNENINAPGQWNAQPSVSPDGMLLFFVSKRPGGAGMHDIWFSTSNGDEQWTPAQNLYSVNTVFMDVSPRFVAADNTLFFSSNGHGGYGGLDVFMAQGKDGFSAIYHLKKPFNSNRDDFFFTPGKKKGYFSSNRKGGLGKDDIYSFEMEKGVAEFIKEIIAGSK
jgi:peptidoglycan-associated lipoprotein